MTNYLMDFIYRYSSTQWIILSTFCVVNILTSFSVSIHAPFYPLAAESRGFSPSIYGIVIGVFNLVTFLISPFCGKLIADAGARFICSCGVFVLGVSNILFGFINDMIYKYTFISFSIILRVIQGIGYAAFQVSSLSIISNEFPNDIENSFACLTSFSSLGFIVGPAVGGYLYEKGGFRLPFIVVGILIILGCSFILYILRRNSQQYYPILMQDVSACSLIKLPIGLLAFSSIFGVYLNTGFIISTLENYMETLNLTPVSIGTMFIFNGLAYSVSSFVWSKLCKLIQPEYIWSIGAVFTIGGLALLSLKALFRPTMKVPACAIGLFIHGIGEGAQIIAGLSGLNYVAKISGYPQDIATYGEISSLYTSALGIGIFIGSVAGCYFYDLIGFQYTALGCSIYHLFLVFGTLIYKYCSSRRYSYTT